jgi:hypothetical protein
VNFAEQLTQDFARAPGVPIQRTAQIGYGASVAGDQVACTCLTVASLPALDLSVSRSLSASSKRWRSAADIPVLATASTRRSISRSRSDIVHAASG